jgi:predicted amino acid dehydrogenase
LSVLKFLILDKIVKHQNGLKEFLSLSLSDPIYLFRRILMKQVISISLGSSNNNYEFQTTFLGQKFKIKRIGTNGDYDKAVDLLVQLDAETDAFGLGSVKLPTPSNNNRLINIASSILDYVRDDSVKIAKIRSRLQTPVTTGDHLINVAYEWAIRSLQFEHTGYFNNARVLFLSGMAHYPMARIMAEYTENLTFADPVIENGISKFLHSFRDLELYAKGAHDILKWVPSKRLTSSAIPIKKWNTHILKKAMQKAQIIVVPYHNFYDYVGDCTPEELGGKTIITTTAYDDRIEFLKNQGVDVIIDTTPKLLKRVVGVNVQEALVIAALGKKQNQITDEDMLELMSSTQTGLRPRLVYPHGEPKLMTRFAFVIHPLSQEQFKLEKTVKPFINIPGAVDAVEKVVAYAPPWIYSKVTGIKSPAGVETEGWLITVGGTPKQMMSHSPEFTYKRLIMAARMAKRLGAQIMGLGAFTKVVGDAGVTVAKKASIPITTGNSYSASGALWAAADAVRRMGLIEIENGKKIKGKTMVFGATGAIGSVCCRLLAMAFDEIYLCGRNIVKLMSLKESILKETPNVKLHTVVNPDKYLKDMDVIVTATSGMGKKILDITKVKPGCVITDVARPLDLSPEEVAKRPDVLVIESGEILLPGDPKLKDIGLPPKVVYACLAETIVLALDRRFEVFTIGRDIEWEKVKSIYKMGLKHGMKLAAISGVNGVFTDEDINQVRNLAIKARKKSKTAKKK